MAIGKKKAIMFGVTAILTSIGAYLLLKKKTANFYDNVWCDGADCCNIKVTTTGYDEVVCDGVGDGSPPTGGDNTGYLNLVFLEPHGLKEGDKIVVAQDEGAAFSSYDGATTVEKVYNENIIRLNKARMGSSSVIGGSIFKDSILNDLVSS